jgi:predicted nucleic acid-binding protein
MALRFVLDTNILIYMLDGKLAGFLPVGKHHVSMISVVELLGFPKLDDAEISRIDSLLAKVGLVPVDEPIARLSAGLRRTGTIKVPDSIVVATAIALGGTLLSNDAKLLGVGGVQCLSIPLI